MTTRSGATNSGGGGGRIALEAGSANVLSEANVSVAGGDGFYADGEPGTVIISGP